MLMAFTVLVACGDPLRDVERLSSVELAQDTARVGALPDPADTVAPAGLFSTLFNNRKSEIAAQPTAAATEQVAPALETDTAVSAALGSAALAATPNTRAAAVAVAPAPQKRGLFGWGRAKTAAPPAAPSVPTPTASPIVEVTPAAPVETSIAQTPAPSPAAPVVEAKPRRGLFGRLAGARAKDQAASGGATVRTASLGPAAAPKAARQTQTAFKARKSKHKGPDVQIVPFGTALPTGAIARVCDLPNGRLGKEVDKFPERGRGYKIFDSNPSASGTRPFYVTGFDDKCARTFTAALALFGSPTLHEQLRYGLPSSKQPYSTTDQAYEGVKRSICGVGKKKPCGAKISQLEKDTAFISIYDRIGSNSKWSNILLHKGWVLAADRKG